MAVSELQKLLIILGAAAVILVGGFLIQKKMLKKKREMDLLGGMGGDSMSSNSASGATPQQSNPQDTDIINYIQQYKFKYSRDSIKQALVGSGKDTSRVEELLNQYF
ncbi:MAG: hypothetical protein ACOCXG_04185 [Nanoarchaeota archaeon]